MTIKELSKEIHHLILETADIHEEQAAWNREIQVRFDFPLQGKKERYKIKSVDKDGTIVLDNPYCEKPQGHA